MESGKYFLGSIIFLGFVAAVMVGWGVVTTSPYALVFLTGGCIGLLWCLFAGKRWWVVVPILTVLTGTFWVGFKIPPGEISVLFAVGALIPSWLMRQSRFIKHRSPLPTTLYILLGYIILHMVVCIFYIKNNNLGSIGSVLRSYSTSIWPLGFAILFHYYADTHYLKAAVIGGYILMGLTILCNIFTVITGIPVIIPGVNFVVSTLVFDEELAEGGLFQIRWTALAFMLLSLYFWHNSCNAIGKLLWLFPIATGFILLLAGGGRGAMLLGGTLVLMWFLRNKNYLLLGLACIFCVLIIATINVEPRVLKHLPYSAQRGLSGFILDKKTSELYGITFSRENHVGSNEFHQMLHQHGYERWTMNTFTVFFGYGLRPYDEPWSNKLINSRDWWWATTSEAADTGAYEKGFWAVTAVFGLFGLLLYGWVLFYYIRNLWKTYWNNTTNSYGQWYVFNAFTKIILWILFCGIMGGFPSSVILFAIIAHSWIEDKAFAQKSIPDSLPEPASPNSIYPHFHQPALISQSSQKLKSFPNETRR